MPKPFLDISVESDRKTKLHVLFNFQEDNKWELKVDRVPGQKMTIEATVNGKKWTGVGNLNQGEMKLNLKMDSKFTGKHYTLDFDLNPSGMWESTSLEMSMDPLTPSGPCRRTTPWERSLSSTRTRTTPSCRRTTPWERSLSSTRTRTTPSCRRTTPWERSLSST